jgi:hypothetical protein
MMVTAAIGLVLASVLVRFGIGGVFRKTDSTPSASVVQSLIIDGRASECTLSAPVRASNFEPEDHPPEAHAEMLLTWLQGENGRTGQWIADDLLEAYHGACLWHGWRERNWVSVGRHFAALSGGKRYTRDENGRRIRVYQVPELSPAPALDPETNVHALPLPAQRRAAVTTATKAA